MGVASYLRMRMAGTSCMRNRIYMAEPEEFLCRPTAEDEAFRKTHTRSGCSYLNLCERFRLRERNYVTQYAHIYFTRLEKMRPYLENAAAREWGMPTISNSGIWTQFADTILHIRMSCSTICCR